MGCAGWAHADGYADRDGPRGPAITGLLRGGNFILGRPASATAQLADRGHKAYPIADRNSPDAFMTVRDLTAVPGERHCPQQMALRGMTIRLELEGGFEPGRIYDVVYSRQRSAACWETDLNRKPAI